MDETVCALLLLTGLCVLSASSPNLHFVKMEMTWNKAKDFCTSKFTGMAKISDKETVNTMMSTPTGEYKGKAWIGLYKSYTEWTWVDGHPATYSNWKLGQPDNTNSESCVSLTEDGFWLDYSCSKKKPAVCFTDGVTANNQTGYYIVETLMNWTEAKSYCEVQDSVLATVLNLTANNIIQEKLDKESEEVVPVIKRDVESSEEDDAEEAWIGLRRHKLWYWSDTGEKSSFVNWQPEQPDNLSGGESCTAAVLEDGGWTDENCSTPFPFFCYGAATSSWKKVVRMKIQSRTDIEDAPHAHLLLQQLHAMFAKKGMTDLTLTWKKTPEKQAEMESRDQLRPDAFLQCESHSYGDEP